MNEYADWPDRDLLATAVQAQRYGGSIGRVATNPQDFAIADRIIALGFVRPAGVAVTEKEQG